MPLLLGLEISSQDCGEPGPKFGKSEVTSQVCSVDGFSGLLGISSFGSSIICSSSTSEPVEHEIKKLNSKISLVTNNRFDLFFIVIFMLFF